jgi:hypothetical protein
MFNLQFQNLFELSKLFKIIFGIFLSLELFKYMLALFHSYWPLLNFFGQVMHFYKKN